MPRKGQDTLVQALPAIRSRVPGAALLLVGGGPYRERLERLVDRTGMADHVVMTGPVPVDELPAHYAAGDVFAMPCRTRNRGLDVEGLGIVYLEASASGLPVVAGDSGGAPDAVLAGETGLRRPRPGRRRGGRPGQRAPAAPGPGRGDGAARPGLGRGELGLGPVGRPPGRAAGARSRTVRAG